MPPKPYRIFRFGMVRNLLVNAKTMQIVSSYFDWETCHWNKEEAITLALRSNPGFSVASIKEEVA